MKSCRIALATVAAVLWWTGLSAPGQVAARELNGFELDGALIPVNAIESGGPPRDGIPAIDYPPLMAAAAADFLAADDRVLGLVVRGEPRAYPIRILNWHEVVNDRAGDQHFVVTYCPLCGTGMVFATNIAGTALVFGVSGLLYNSDVLLYDRNTESLWSQILSKAVTGPLRGTTLPAIPVVHTTWQAWRDAHPRTRVLGTDTGFDRDYRSSPYRGYERSPRLYFDVVNRAPRDYHPKALVMGVLIDGVAKAYPFEALQARGDARFDDRVGGTPITVFWDAQARSARAESADGEPLATVTGYWFAWYAFHPDTAVLAPGSGN